MYLRVVYSTSPCFLRKIVGITSGFQLHAKELHWTYTNASQICPITTLIKIGSEGPKNADRPTVTLFQCGFISSTLQKNNTIF